MCDIMKFLVKKDEKHSSMIKENNNIERDRKTQSFRSRLNSLQENDGPLKNKNDNSVVFCKYCNHSQQSWNGMMRVLLDQNSNLKQQNYFLQQQIAKMSQKQDELSQTLYEYESIMSILNQKNIQLHRQLFYFSDKANTKVNKLKSVINNFVEVKRNPSKSMAPIQSFQSERQFNNKLKNSRVFKRINTQVEGALKPKMIHRSPSADDLPCATTQFERLFQEYLYQDNTSKKFHKIKQNS